MAWGSSEDCNEFDQYVVHDEQLQCPEFCVKASVDFSQKNIKTSTTTDMVKIVTALMNSSGGVVSLESSKQVDDVTTNEWKAKFMEQLIAVLSEVDYTSCIKLVYQGYPTHTIHVLVKRSAQFVTYDFGMYHRIDSMSSL